MKTPIRDMSIAVNTVDFERLLAAAIECEKVKETLKCAEAKIVRMRAELTRYQEHCERAKANSEGTDESDANGNRASCEDVKKLATAILESEANNDGRA